jgi:hypothetical protein
MRQQKEDRTVPAGEGGRKRFVVPARGCRRRWWAR